ncbi:MAG: hypothetical protein ABW110_09895 [Steroidobacteraceae bacterium]
MNEQATHDAGGAVNNRPALRAFAALALQWLLLILLLLAGGRAFAQAATPAGTQIRNAAQLAYQRSGIDVAIASNEVIATVARPSTRANIELLRASDATATEKSTAGPTQCMRSGSFETLAAPKLTAGSALDPTQPVSLSKATIVHGGEPLFVQVSDPDQDFDGTAIDTIDVRVHSATGDTETLRLAETAPSSGVFVGYIQTGAAAAAAGDCILQVDRNSSVDSFYVDAADPSDAVQASALVDPFGIVFDSRTGAPMDGARVRLVNASTGARAAVLGDDGVSAYPAEMITGSAVTDAGGTTYTLPAGVFRFPLVAAGEYKLEITPPRGHSFPSAAAMTSLATIPGAPYRLSTASYGADFIVVSGPSIAVDVPLDAAPTQLFVQKTTTTAVAAVGDFIEYRVEVENASSQGTFSNVQVVDTLPAGLRFREGSARIGTQRVDDPSISSDGRTLTFTVNSLPSGERATVRYVAEVTVGARGDQIVNSARAVSDDGTQSNTAQAIVQLREELFRDHSFLAGRVTSGTCDQAANEQPGIPGVRIYMEDGRYAVTDENGKYHFEDVQPGTHVVQLDTATVPSTHELAPCNDHVAFAGRSYSQFVDLRGGALWRADFTLQPRQAPAGSVQLQLQTALSDASTLAHLVQLEVQQLGIDNTRLLVMLPDGLSYVPGTTRIDGRESAEPVVNENILSFDLKYRSASSHVQLGFHTRTLPHASGLLPLKAVVLFDSGGQQQRTPPVENVALRGEMQYENASYRVPVSAAAEAQRKQLERIAAQWQPLGSLRLKVSGDAESTTVAGQFLRERLNIPADRVELDLIAGADTEIFVEGLRVRSAGTLMVRTAQAKAVATTLAPVPGVQPQITPPNKPLQPSADIALDVETLQPQLQWLNPVDGALVAIPSIKVAVQHASTQQVELSLNGHVVSPLNFDGTALNRARTAAVSRWRGLDLVDGDNELVAVVHEVGATEPLRITRHVHYAGGAVRAELVREESRLTADGQRRPVIALKLFDAYGKPARPGTLGAWSIGAPYRSQWEVEALTENQLVAVGPREPTFEVGSDGIARLELEPTTQAGYALVHLRFNERQQQEMRVWLEPAARDWILVGVAEGTAAYKTLSDHMQAAEAADADEGYQDNGRVAFFAKGAIKGEYLLTLAYDSDRDHEVAKQRLLGVVEPDRFYTLYGDATEQRFEAATARKLFLKLERRQFAALFGDYETGLTVTELTRYSRTFTGFKSDYAGEHVGYTAFAAESDQGYVQDELRGDGTSGLYRLSRRPLIVNSDNIRIETRDRIRTEVVVDSRTLTRHLDYSIDYLSGTLFFKQPVPSRDASFNPVFIIADYEVLTGGKREVTAGGRTALKLAKDAVEIGASYINQGATTGDTQVMGTDLRWQINSATELKAEIARSESDDPTQTDRADAYLAEMAHVTERLDARAYVREQETGFGVGQQLSTEAGTRKVGVDGIYKIADKWLMRGEAFQQDMLQTDAQRELVSTEVRRETADYTLGAGARHVADSGLAAGTAKSEQGFVNGTLDLFKDRITLKAAQDFAIASDDASPDFPARSLVGVEYHWSAATTLFTAYEHAKGRDLKVDMTRVGVRTTPWDRAQLSTSLNQQASEYGPRTFAQLGLIQGWQVSERWALDFGVDQSRTVSGDRFEQLNANAPLASGSLSGDFVATFAGATYRSETWTVTSRLERRDADEEERWVFAGGFYREPIDGHAFSLATQLFDSTMEEGSDTTGAEVDLSWAYRPVDSRWIVLDRLDLKDESRDDVLGRYESARIVNNLNANWQLDRSLQLGLQFGARYVRSTFDGERYDGLSDLYGVDVRRDLSSRFDIGLHGTLLNSWQADVSDYAVGLDLGWTIARNVWISLGYNVQGFRDTDFEASRYTARGPYLKFRMKADQDTFKDLSLDRLRPKEN